MTFLVVGAGAIGGVVGARLHAAGHAVTLVARGAQLDAIRTRGLTIHTPRGTQVHRVPAIEQPFVDEDTIILLAVKSQDVTAALRELAIVAPASTPIVCLTNGIAAEALALRWFDRVYGCCVTMPVTFLEPGVLDAWGDPVSGLLDIGCYPAGIDDVCTQVVDALSGAQLSSRADADIMRWKRGKLLLNLTNALEALCGPAGRDHELATQLRDEALRVFAAAQLTTTTASEVAARYGGWRTTSIEGRARTGGSTWQSLARGAVTLECEYLNGEITQLGRFHGVPTPLNDAVLREVTRAAAAGTPPGSRSIDELHARLT